MKEVKELFQNVSLETTVRHSINGRQNLAFALSLGFLLASLALSGALAAGPTGWESVLAGKLPRFRPISWIPVYTA